MEKWSKNRTSDFFGHEILRVYDQEIEVLEKVYAILYKSAGYISSDEDEFWYLSYKKQMLDCPYVNLLHVAGRLDTDTEWLLLLSNDGQFIHQTISPKREKEKEYEVWLISPISAEECESLRQGVKLDDGYLTKPAKVEHIEEKKDPFDDHWGEISSGEKDAPNCWKWGDLPQEAQDLEHGRLDGLEKWEW